MNRVTTGTAPELTQYVIHAITLLERYGVYSGSPSPGAETLVFRVRVPGSTQYTAPGIVATLRDGELEGSVHVYTDRLGLVGLDTGFTFNATGSTRIAQEASPVAPDMIFRALEVIGALARI